MDPVILPSTPLFSSYTFHSPISSWTKETYRLNDALADTQEGLPEGEGGEETDGRENKVDGSLDVKAKEKGERWVMGIDEAGRGPVLGPMVYACAFAPLSFLSTLQNLGFDDSKALSHATRDHLFSLFQNPSSPPSKPRSDSTSPDDDDDAQEPTGYHQLHYSTRVLSPADISRDMLRGVSPVNLNKQAEDATVLLIGEVQRMGIDIAECYVDALGACGPYQAKLSSLFPTITFDVRPKADSLFKIVGAASIAAKITRDRYLTHWIHPESALNPPSTSSSSSALPPSLTPTSSTSLAVPTPLSSTSAATTSFTSSTTSSSEALIDPDGTIIQDGQNDETAAPPPAKKRKVAAKGKGKAVAAGKGKGKGKEKKKKLVKVEEEGDEGEAGSGEEDEDVEELEEAEVVKNGLGSGYPSDPTTKRYLTSTLDPTFGFPSLVRFSWATAKVLLEKQAHPVRWIDEVGGGSSKKTFFAAGKEAIADRERTRVWKEVGLRNVSQL